MGNTLAIHWAATTHGTWLHGDPRGSWWQGRLIGPDPFLEAAARASISAEAVVLESAEQTMVADVFGDVIHEHGHRVYAATIQATHMHLVLAPVREDLTVIVARLKRRSAAAVLARRRSMMTGNINSAETASLYSRPILGRNAPRSLWTASKFLVCIFDERQLCNTIEYVRDHNRRIGLPADPFNWIDPLYPAGDAAGERFYPHERCVSPRP